LPEAAGDFGEGSFIGELPGVGMIIALDKLVSKDELDRIRNAFPTRINRVSPTNSPVKLVVYVLDVPAQRILDAAGNQDLPALADDVESWGFDVATVVDDVSQSYILAHEQGEWDAALRRVRKALRKEGGRTNAYLRRIAAHCSFSLGDWPSALKYAREAVTLDRRELGSGLVRSLCQEGDAYLCLGDPVRAWDLYSEAAAQAPTHPLPRSYRGQALLLMARLLRVYEDEHRRAEGADFDEAGQVDVVLNTLANGAMEDLTSAADLLDRWGLIPESYQYRNFHLVPTLLGQGTGYLITRSPGPAASRLQSARRSFPKDDLFFREFLFAKCWEQGLHRRYGKLLLGDQWAPLRDRLHEAFGEPPS
jgi:tetratricopeptide (TPR) repeat protein